MEVSLIIIVLYKAELSFGSQLKQCLLLLQKLIYLFKKTGKDKNINRNKCSLKPTQSQPRILVHFFQNFFIA